MRYENEKLKEISFPLGGIGTGSIGLAGNGGLIDWEIFNKPAKGSVNRASHFAVRAIEGDKITARILNGDMTRDLCGQYKRSPNFTGYGFGPDASKMCGFPHFKNTVFNGEFPIARIGFSDERFPGNIVMTAFNPFIPRDAYNSSIPAAFFEIELENTNTAFVKYQVALSVASPYAKSRNVSKTKDGCRCITMYNAGAAKESVQYGDLTVATDCETAFTQSYWYRGSWRDGVVTFWNEFSSEINLKEREYGEAGEYDACTLMAEADVRPGEKKRIRFVLSWSSPNNYNYWTKSDEKDIRKPWKNYYATVFEDSLCSALYSLANFDTLYERTLRFKNALHSSTLPPEVIDAAASNLAVLKSPTVLRLSDGSFYGWEGVMEYNGSCEGTCQHVWNYAYALCFLFPELERSIRELEFKHGLDADGKMPFRLLIPFDKRGKNTFRACVDGQMGTVVKCYREWKISGDSEWLRANWENISSALEYAWSPENPDAWDRDRDGVLEGRQHHTLDMELFGPSSWLEGMYLLALSAASEMADFLGDTEKAREYKALFESGYKWTKENLFNGKYFIQKVDVSDKSVLDAFGAADTYWNDEAREIKYQIADGSSIDQMLAQWHADILGLGSVFDKEQISKALSEMMKNNFKPNMRYVVNPWRIFSLNDEAGSVICVYPEGVKKPKIPVAYCEETMTGFEYSFAGLLCAEGRIEDGIKAVKAVRDRFDGEKRNPYNEFECGSNYARSMASYALIPILSGFEFDMPRGHIGFDPYIKDSFSCVWSLDGGYGDVKVDKTSVKINIYEGELRLSSVGVKFIGGCKTVKIDGNEVGFDFKDGSIHFDEAIVKREIEISL